MALPNGGCAPFVQAIDSAAPEKVDSAKTSVVVDLSADYRFSCGEETEVGKRWTYGLPGERA